MRGTNAEERHQSRGFLDQFLQGDVAGSPLGPPVGRVVPGSSGTLPNPRVKPISSLSIGAKGDGKLAQSPFPDTLFRPMHQRALHKKCFLVRFFVQDCSNVGACWILPPVDYSPRISGASGRGCNSSGIGR